MKKRWKTIFWIVAFIAAIGLGILDGLQDVHSQEAERTESSVQSEPADVMESGIEIMKNAFRWHFRFKYPELLILDSFFGEMEKDQVFVCAVCGAEWDSAFCGDCGSRMNHEG